MTIKKFNIVIYPNINTDWHIINSNQIHLYSIQFPLLSKPKLISSEGECISRIYTDKSNSFLRYIGLYNSNQIFTLKFNLQSEEFLLGPMNLICGKFSYYWKLIKSEHSLQLIDLNTREVVVKVNRTLNGNDLASIEVSKDMDDQLLSVILFSACILLKQSKILKSSPKLNNNEKFFVK